jgi:trans-aconitate methyltransferase
VRENERALPGIRTVRQVLDLGCATGASGAAWAIDADRCTLSGIDRHPWAIAEANWTYRRLGLGGRAVRGNIERVRLAAGAGDAILAAYAVNELPEPVREILLPRLLDAHRRGARILIVEPIARGIAAWWPRWEKALTNAGGLSNEWRFRAELPPRQQQLARAAGLNPREYTARTISL